MIKRALFLIRATRWISFLGLVTIALVAAYAWGEEAGAQQEEHPEEDQSE